MIYSNSFKRKDSKEPFKGNQDSSEKIEPVNLSVKDEDKNKKSFWNKNPKKKYFGLWYIVDDYDSAKNAAKLSLFALGLLIGLYIIYFQINPPNDNLYQTQSFQLLFGEISKIAGLILPILFIIRIGYQEKYGLIPLTALWTILEFQYFLFNLWPNSSSRMVMMLIVISIAINSLRGWWGLRKYSETNSSDVESIWKK